MNNDKASKQNIILYKDYSVSVNSSGYFTISEVSGYLAFIGFSRESGEDVWSYIKISNYGKIGWYASAQTSAAITSKTKAIRIFYIKESI